MICKEILVGYRDPEVLIEIGSGWKKKILAPDLGYRLSIFMNKDPDSTLKKIEYGRDNISYYSY